MLERGVEPVVDALAAQSRHDWLAVPVLALRNHEVDEQFGHVELVVELLRLCRPALSVCEIANETWDSGSLFLACQSGLFSSAYGELILVTAGGFQLPLRIEGSPVVGQYMRNVKLKAFAAEGSQLDCLSCPGESCWM